MNFLITGGSRGLGRQLVLDMVNAGHGVALTFRSDEAAAQATLAQAHLVSANLQCRAYRLDQRDCAAVESVCDEVLGDFGDIHALVNNAGVNQNSLAISTSDDLWQDILQTNLSGPFYLSRALLPHFLGNRSGRIIHISSVAMHGASGQACYAASKAGLIGLSGTLAREYGGRGVTSNVLLLGLLAGGMSSGAEAGAASTANRETWRTLCPARREGELAEVSGLVAFLASQAASFVNGQAIAVNGGMDWVP
jgi:3-oxoacyl-[acyl-carrier protein] reductase